MNPPYNGGLQKWIAEKEYPMDGRRLDVTWRRIERGAPTYVFALKSIESSTKSSTKSSTYGR